MTEDALDMSGKVVLVTGGSRGIGRGIASAFAERGARLVVCGRKERDAGVSDPWTHLVCDVREPDQCERLIARVVELEGRLDVLVNNAGGAPFVEASKASPRLSQSVILLNLLAPLWLSQQAYAVMRGQPTGGSIVNIASVSGTRASPGTAAYGAAKAGLLNLTKTLGVEWAPLVRVNAVIVGLARTEAAHLHYGDEAGVAAAARTVPMGRMAEPRDVADACLFLCSPLASYMTGAALELHGGGERPAFLDAVSGARAQ